MIFKNNNNTKGPLYLVNTFKYYCFYIIFIEI